MSRKFLVVFLILILGLTKDDVFAQSTSNKGKDFWVAYAGHIDGTESKMTLFLSTDVNTTYNVTSNGIVISSGNIVANQVTAVFIDPVVYNVHISTSDLKEVNKGINITTADPISVYCVISNKARTGSTLILPTSTLEQEYYVFSQQNKGITNAAVYSEFTVVGIKDGTKVEITPTQASRSGAVRSANTTFEITLNKGDVYQYQAVNDLTGSLVKSITGCSPIAVFSGNTWAAYCEAGNNQTNPSGGDNLFQQLFPVTAWGKNFVSAPFYNTLNGNTDVVKIIVSEDNTIVNVNGSTTVAVGTNLSNPYRKGSVITFYTNEPSVIKASSPIAVAQYQTSQNCNTSNRAPALPYQGDPEMTILNPIEQTLKDITVYSRLNSVSGVNTNIEKYFLNIIIKTTDISGFTLDGATISSQFKPISNSDYSYAVVDVTNSSDQHRLVASGGFVAIAYGYGQVESYAYLAGTDLKNLKSNIQVFSAGSNIPSTNFCSGTNFDFVLKLPYITEKLTWNLNNGTKIEVINSPGYTTLVEDGQTYYVYNYSLPRSQFTTSGNYVLKAVIKRPVAASCVADEEISATFDVFSPDFTLPAEACVNIEVSFTDKSPTTGGNIKSWAWNFGDGTTSTVQSPKHKYKTPGIKSVVLKVVTDIGCNLEVTKTINILAAPKSDFNTVGPLCINGTVQFANTSTAVNSNIVSQIWDFGNGELSSTAVAPTTTFKVAGDYTVKLISTSSAGCADTVIKTVTIYDYPEITFNDPASCVNDVVKYEATVVKGNITSWLWDFGDGTNDIVQKVLQNPTHKYTATGTYTVKLIGQSTQGCSVVFTRQVVISGSNPTTLFEVKTAANLCANVDVSFENKSTVGFGNITKIEWIFDYKVGGPNTIVTDNNPTFGKIYTYRYPNKTVKTDYNVVMRVYSGQICFSESAPVTVSVYPAPVIKFVAIGPVCEDFAPFKLVATEENGVAGSSIFTGTGVSANGVFNPRLAGAGNFNIKYIYSATNGCTEEKNINITVDKTPTLTMPPDIDILLGGEKVLNAEATGGNLKFKWSPAEGLSADNILNPIAKPNKTTTYTLTLSSNTCNIVLSVVVRVHENPLIPNVFSPNGDGKNDTWNIKYLESFTAGNIVIFNRYGQKVFFASPYNTPWDGKINGTDVPVGTYYYIIEPNNGRKKYTGSVTILR